MLSFSVVMAHDVDTGRLRRIRFALLIGAIALFALLYAPQPVLPQLSRAFALSPGSAALLVSASTLGLALAAIPLGTLSEAVGRRRTMLLSLVVAEALGLCLPWVHDFPLMVVLRLVQGAAVAGMSSVAVAYLVGETGGRQMGTTMGLYVAGTTIGGMSGRLLGGIAGDFAGWSGGMLTVAALAGGCTLLFVALLPAERNHTRQELRWAPLARGLRSAASDPVLYAPYLVAALGMGSFVTVYNVLSFRLTSAPFHVDPALAALAFLAYAAGTVTSAVAGGLADRWGRTRVLVSGLVAVLAGFGLMLVGDLPTIIVGLVVFTGGFFIAHSVASAWVGERALPSARGQATALYQFAYYAGSSVGGVLGGLAYAAWGWSGMTAMLGCWIVLAGAAVLVAAGREAPAEPAAAAGGEREQDQVASGS